MLEYAFLSCLLFCKTSVFTFLGKGTALRAVQAREIFIYSHEYKWILQHCRTSRLSSIQRSLVQRSWVEILDILFLRSCINKELLEMIWSLRILSKDTWWLLSQCKIIKLSSLPLCERFFAIDFLGRSPQSTYGIIVWWAFSKDTSNDSSIFLMVERVFLQRDSPWLFVKLSLSVCYSSNTRHRHRNHTIDSPFISADLLTVSAFVISVKIETKHLHHEAN